MSTPTHASTPASLATIERAVADLRDGRFVIIVDDPDRENEGDLCIAAERISPDAVNFMAREARGLICVPMAPSWVDRLGLPAMVEEQENTSRFGTAFTVSVEAREGVTTGISAFDRATTIRKLADPAARPSDFAFPGHVFPLRARAGGVLERGGQTEASVDLVRLAGLQPVAVICEVMAEDGRMARLPELERFAARHDIVIVSVADLHTYRLAQMADTPELSKSDKAPSPTGPRRVAETSLPTDYGLFQLYAYDYNENGHDGGEPALALVLGRLDGDAPVLARVHSECLTGDVFGSRRCDCGQQLDRALDLIGQAGCGVIIYLRQEGRGIGLVNKLHAYRLQDQGLDTVEANRRLGFPADGRDYGLAATIFRDLGVQRLRLLTNNPAKVAGLQAHGIEVVERVPLEIAPHSGNQRYLETKRHKLGHLLTFGSSDERTRLSVG